MFFTIVDMENVFLSKMYAYSELAQLKIKKVIPNVSIMS